MNMPSWNQHERLYVLLAVALYERTNITNPQVRCGTGTLCNPGVADFLNGLLPVAAINLVS